MRCISERFGPENGYATFDTRIPIPNHVKKILRYPIDYLIIGQVSVCFKIFVDFIRYGGQVGVMEILRLGEEKPSMSLLCK